MKKIYVVILILLMGLQSALASQTDYYPYNMVVNDTNGKSSKMFTKSTKTVVLLLDSEKKNASVVIENGMGSTVIDKVGQYVAITSPYATPSTPKDMSKEETIDMFGSLAFDKAEKSLKYIIYFDSTKSKLASNSKILNIIESLKSRKNLYIILIGHSDTIGLAELNYVMAQKRAEYVASIIRKSGLSYEHLQVESYGESDLAVLTPDKVSERLNRRVEILVR